VPIDEELKISVLKRVLLEIDKSAKRRFCVEKIQTKLIKMKHVLSTALAYAGGYLFLVLLAVCLATGTRFRDSI
jgi:hypothetical protein